MELAKGLFISPTIEYPPYYIKANLSKSLSIDRLVYYIIKTNIKQEKP